MTSPSTPHPAVPTADPVAVAATVARLRATFATGRTRDLGWRADQLRGLLALLDEHRDDLTAAIHSDLRRPLLQASMLDLTSTRAEAQHALGELQAWAAPERVKTSIAAKPGRAWVQYAPLGVVLVIAPWNYPVHLALAPAVAALAAGNCVIVKPSEATPACSALLADLLPRFLDPEAVAVVEGGAEASQELLAQGLDHVFFTGSPAVGRKILAGAAEHLTPVTLELGGKCPAVVTASADLRVAARRIAWGKLTNSGQTCVAPDYVLVDRGVRDEFVAELTATLRRFSEDSPVPILSGQHTARLQQLAQEAGGQTVLGGTADPEEATMEPTVIVDPDPSASVMQEEIFGPILPVVTVDGVEAAIAHVQAGTHPLASYLFSTDDSDHERFLAQVSTGGVVINHVMLHLSVPDLPFGGVGTSGMGRYHGKWGFQTFSNAKAVLKMGNRPDLPLIYPPYTGVKKWILERG